MPNSRAGLRPNRRKSPSAKLRNKASSVGDTSNKMSSLRAKSGVKKANLSSPVLLRLLMKKQHSKQNAGSSRTQPRAPRTASPENTVSGGNLQAITRDFRPKNRKSSTRIPTKTSYVAVKEEANTPDVTVTEDVPANLLQLPPMPWTNKQKSFNLPVRMFLLRIANWYVNRSCRANEKYGISKRLSISNLSRKIFENSSTVRQVTGSEEKLKKLLLKCKAEAYKWHNGHAPSTSSVKDRATIEGVQDREVQKARERFGWTRETYEQYIHLNEVIASETGTYDPPNGHISVGDNTATVRRTENATVPRQNKIGRPTYTLCDDPEAGDNLSYSDGDLDIAVHVSSQSEVGSDADDVIRKIAEVVPEKEKKPLVTTPKKFDTPPVKRSVFALDEEKDPPSSSKDVVKGGASGRRNRLPQKSPEKAFEGISTVLSESFVRQHQMEEKRVLFETNINQQRLNVEREQVKVQRRKQLMDQLSMVNAMLETNDSDLLRDLQESTLKELRNST